ncbi:MAG: tetratricopeptide repeat protein, partial [Bacteroidia bacterium]
MNRLLSITFALLFMLAVPASSKAQKTREYTDAAPTFQHAKMLYVKELYVPAINEFKEFIKSNPGPNFDYEARAYIMLSRLKLDKQNSSRDLARFLREEPEHKLNTEITYELGLYYFNKGRYSRALKYLEQINEADVSKSQREELAFKQGYSFFKNKEYQKAKDQFKKIMNGNGRYAVEANYYYGYQCYILKDYACAISTFEKIGDKGPKTMQLYLAQMYYEQEEYTKAFDIIQNVKLSKRQDEIELLTGKIQYQLGNISVALIHFDNYKGDVKALSSDEVYQFAYANFDAERYAKATQYFILVANEDSQIGQAANYHLGESDVKNGKKERALNAFAEAKRKDYNKKIGEIAAFNYAKLAAELEKNSTAVSSIKKFLEDYPRSEYRNEAKSMMADIFLSTKNYKAAIEVLEDIGDLNNDSKKAYQELTFHRGEELYLNKEYQNADVFFKKSLRYPKDKKLEALSYFWRSEIAFKVDDYNESINLMNRFMSNSGSDQSDNKNYGYYSMGYSYFKKQDYPKAQNYFAKFNQHETFGSENRRIYLDNTQRLADCYFLNGQYSPAIKEYGFIIKNNYKSADYALFQQGMLYGLQERHSEKINVLKKIQNDFPKSIYYDDALYQSAREYTALGNYSTAKSIYNVIISQHDYSPYLPDSYLKLGLINYNQSNDDEAMGYFKTVVERFPKTSSSKEALTFIEILYTSQGNPQGYFDYVKDIPGAEVRITAQDSVIYNHAMTVYNSKDYTGASKELGAYIKKFGENGVFIIAAHYFKAECDYYTDKEDQALVHYDYVVSQSRNKYTEKSLIKLSSTYFYRKNYTKAAAYYAKLEPIAANKNTFISSIMGQMRCHYELGDYALAKKKAIQVLPIEDVPKEDLVEANMVLGRLQLKDNNLRTAKFHFDYVIAESRNVLTAEALYHRAFIRYDQNELDSSRNDVYKLNDDFSAYEYWVVKGFILLGDIYVKEEDYFQ